MPKQHQILAVEKTVKANAEQALTAVHHKLQKADTMIGLSRVYTPKDENGTQLPPERKLVQVLVRDEIELVGRHLAALFDVVATKDWTNTKAKADVVIDGKALLTGVPVTYLLFLNKQLINLNTFVRKMHLLDPSEKWTFDPNRGCHVTEPVHQIKTKKVPFNHVKFAGDEHHPPQVDVEYEDVHVGTWKITKMCGAMALDDLAGIVERINQLSQAVKKAIAEANGCEAHNPDVGKTILSYVFDGSA